ncbi:MAG TPA: hypothetical protein VGE58_02200 [Daejeonella sp.]
MGEQQLASWIGTHTNTNSNYRQKLKNNEFLFVNFGKESTVTFYYNNSRITLGPQEESQPFVGTPPRSLSDCRVTIDNIPLDQYYRTLKKITDQENVVKQVTGGAFHHNKSAEQLNREIGQLTPILQDMQAVRSSMPAWFGKMHTYDFRIKQVEDILQTLKKNLQEKKSASSTTTASGNTTSQSTSSQTNTSAKSNEASSDFWSERPSRSKEGENRPVTQDQGKMTREQMNAKLERMFADNAAKSRAVEQKIEQTMNAWRLNYYYAEAVRSGKANLAQASRLDGNYSSIKDLEADFNQKYSAITYEVNNLQQARNSKLNNAVDANFNGSSTEQAIGQGMKLLGGIINSAQASKEEKAAQAALAAERERQLAAIAAAKRQAMLDLRNKLMTTFPPGGTPITSHKVTKPEVFIFAYITDKAAFNNEQAAISVSNVFPVQKYSDGTYPYKTTILNKLKGYAPGEVTIVGYYADRSIAEQMRNSFVNLASKSNLTVKGFAVKNGSASTSTGTLAKPGDFWENGTKAAPAPEDKAGKKTDFWNN